MPANVIATRKGLPPSLLFVAVICAVSAGSAFANLPELGLVVFLTGSTFVADAKKQLQLWQKRISRCSSARFALCVAIMLLVSLLLDVQRLIVTLISALGYFLTYQLGRQHKEQKEGSSTFQPPEARPQPPRVACTTQWKRPGFTAKSNFAKQRESRGAVRAPSHGGQFGVVQAECIHGDIHGTPGSPNFEVSFGRSVRSTDVEGVPSAFSHLCEPLQKLIRREAATEADEHVANNLAQMVRDQIASHLRCDFDVRGIPCGNLLVIGQTGEKPEVDVIVSIGTAFLQEHLAEFALEAPAHNRPPKNFDTLRRDTLMRTATRALSDRLVGLRFWRSQFTGPEVKIVLLVPVALGLFEYPIRMNFSVNTPYPVRLHHVIKNADLGTMELVLLVKRWADDRGIAKTNKGHLHPYAWSLLVINFLRCWTSQEHTGEKTSIELFAEFVHFYADAFEGRGRHIAVSFNGRDIQMTGESMLWGIPFIEDPFDPSRNVARTMTADGVKRLTEELSRAARVLARGQQTTLDDLLAKWTPPAGAWP